MSLYCGIAFKRKFFWCYRLLSTYVTKTRYLFELKEDDDACKKAQQTGAFYLFHGLAPLLQTSAHQYAAPQHSLLELERLLGKFGQDAQRIEDSVLIGCSEQQKAWFALDLGLDNSSSILASLPKPEMETELKGSFIELRKALFQLNAKDASLLSTIQVNLRELETAAWFSHHEVATALKRKGPYTQKENGTFPFWLPPKLAISHQLIKEWVEKQTSSSLPA
uniref:Nudix hydrolase 13 n=1 Tax=Saimiri boliviensis boliviensis TaxID=39432 RepID=A0A2K6TB34_SAIBB